MSSSSSETSPPRPTRLVVGGLPVSIYGLEALPAPSLSSSPSQGLAVFFLLHGRLSSSSHPLIPKFAHALLSHASAAKQAANGQGKDLLVVTFDQRNHGHREVEKERSLGWVEGSKKRLAERASLGLRADELDNPSHAVDVVSLQAGTAQDVSFLINFLPPALFPGDEREVTEWYCGGISLGGHSTWLALANDPRITLGIPIIGSPSSLTLLTHRALNLPPPAGPLPASAPYLPASLVSLLKRVDPDQRPMEVWKGKKVLVMSGEEDGLVSYVEGGTERFVERLREEGGLEKLEVWVQEKTGHACTPEMIARSCEFVWAHGLSSSSSSLGGKL
ncbi:hypothetical protein JCM8547_008940 [Rhodosporidiobolus lusitaniae]